MIKTDVLIIGAGVTGLSCGWHLEKAGLFKAGKRKYILVEKENKIGGLAGSTKKDGFIFDCSGHLLHLHNPRSKAFILRLLRGNLSLLKRNSWIYSHNIFTRYPFQANTFGLPKKVVSECVSGFLKAYRKARMAPDASRFDHWALSVFGTGICRHFMFPFNSKLWQYPLSRLSADWCAPFVPRPSPDEVIRGAYWDQKKSFGYSAYFRYPVRGGCQALPEALARGVKNIKLNSKVASINLADKTAMVKPLGKVKYNSLINTMPLNELLDITEGIPEKTIRAGRKLKYTSVYVLNLGIDRTVSDAHWMYFPQALFPFYRVGVASNFSRHISPKGTSSLYIEVSRRHEAKTDIEKLEKEIINGLIMCGILKKSDKILTRLWQKIRCGYVIYDKERKKSLETIFDFLNRNQIYSIGRYGGWKYSFMEESILDGKRCAQELSDGLKRVQRTASAKELKPLR